MRQLITSTGSSFRRTTPCTTCGRVHEGGDCRKRTIQCFECGGSGHIRRDCPNLAQFGTSTGRGVQSTAGRGGRTFGFSRGTGRGVGASVSREGGASTLTHPIRPVQIERPTVQPRVFAITQQEAASSHDVISGRLTIFGESAYILIDLGATHSFIASSFKSCIPWEKSVMN